MELNHKTYVVTVEEDWIDGGLILPFPKELLDSMEWEEGDQLLWDDNGDGTFTLSRKD